QVMASRVPGVPGLAVGVQQFGHQLLLGGGWETRGDQLPGEDLVVVRVPVVLLLLRQRREQAPRDDVLDADEVRVAGVAVEQDARDEVVRPPCSSGGPPSACSARASRDGSRRGRRRTPAAAAWTAAPGHRAAEPGNVRLRDGRQGGAGTVVRGCRVPWSLLGTLTRAVHGVRITAMGPGTGCGEGGEAHGTACSAVHATPAATASPWS